MTTRPSRSSISLSSQKNPLNAVLVTPVASVVASKTTMQPSRIDGKLIAMFKRHNTAPFYLMTQFNHPREITEDAVRAVSLFVDAGIPALNQSVLLRGVNDNSDVLEELCNRLLMIRGWPLAKEVAAAASSNVS